MAEAGVSDLLIWPAVAGALFVVVTLIGSARLIQRRRRRIRRGNLRSRLFK
jgi:hypothetical protein